MPTVADRPTGPGILEALLEPIFVLLRVPSEAPDP